MSLFIPSLQSALEEHSDPGIKLWWERYLKGSISFLGVSTPHIRSILKRLYRQYQVKDWNRQQKLDLATTLMEKSQAEYKLAAILLYQIWYIQEMDADTIIFNLEKWYQKRLIADWNTGDWLSVRILSPLLEQSPKITIKHLDEWIQHGYVWKARAALVALSLVKDISPFKSKLMTYSGRLIQRPERFAKTAVGWALRQYSKTDFAPVQDFLLKNSIHVSTEVFNNACKYLDREEKKSLKSKIKPSSQRGTE